jgi:hypothetical protein
MSKKVDMRNTTKWILIFSISSGSILALVGFLTNQFSWAYIYSSGGGTAWWFLWLSWERNFSTGYLLILTTFFALLGTVLVFTILFFNKSSQLKKSITLGILGSLFYIGAFIFHLRIASTMNNPTNFFKFDIGFYFSSIYPIFLIFINVILIIERIYTKKRGRKLNN